MNRAAITEIFDYNDWAWNIAEAIVAASGEVVSTQPLDQAGQAPGRAEIRSQAPDDRGDEFYHVYDLPADFGGLNDALLAWNHRYESWRPHQALGYLTPDQFYQQWLSNQPQRKEAVSDMP